MGRKLLFFLALAAFAVAMYLVFRRDFDSRLFLESVTDVRPMWLAASTVLTFVNYVVRSFRWQILLISMKLIKMTSLVGATILGFAVIYLLGRAGEFARPVWIARTEGVAMAGSFATIVVERVFDTLMLILLFAATVGVVGAETGATGAIDLLTTSVWLLLALSSVALLVFILFRAHVPSIARRLSFERLSTTLERFGDGLAITGSWRNLGLTTVYSLLLWVGIALQFWLMLFGLNLEFTFRAATLVLVASAIGSIAQVPGIGGGFQVGFIFCVTTFFLVPLETAVGASLLAWFFTYVPTIVVAAIYMTWKGISARDLITPEPA